MNQKYMYELKFKADEIAFAKHRVKSQLDSAYTRMAQLDREFHCDIIYLMTDILILSVLFVKEESIVANPYAVWYPLAIRFMAIVSIPFLGFRLFRGIYRLFHHNADISNWTTPRPKITNSDIGIPAEKNYRGEIEKLSWIDYQYCDMQKRIEKMQSRLEKGEEISSEEWVHFIESIVIYEPVKRARK